MKPVLTTSLSLVLLLAVSTMADNNDGSHDAHRIDVQKYCDDVQKECIASGAINDVSMVCTVGGESFLNQCTYKARACDIFLTTGEVLLEETCLWNLHGNTNNHQHNGGETNGIGGEEMARERTRRDMENYCTQLKRNCVVSGDIFKRSVVCAGHVGKRFLNRCALQIRSCELYLDRGEVLVETRCLWVEKDDDDHSGKEVSTITPGSSIIVDYFGTAESSSTQDETTAEEPNTTFFWPSEFIRTKVGLEITTEPYTTTTSDYFGTTESSSTQDETTKEESVTILEGPSEPETTTEEPATTLFGPSELETTTEEPTTTLFGPSGLIRTTVGLEITTEPYTTTTSDYFISPEFSDDSLYDNFSTNDDPEENCCRGDKPTCPSCTRDDLGGQVCGTNGVTYTTQCELDLAACAAEGDENLQMQNQGKCPLRGDIGKR